MSLTRRRLPYTSQMGHYAGFATRSMAFIIDMVIVSSILFFGSWVINTALSMFQMDSLFNTLIREQPRFKTTINFIFSPLFGSIISVFYIFLYYVFFWFAAGQSPGKAIMGIKIVHIHGKKLSLLRVILRYLGYFLSAIPLGLGFLWILIDDRRMGWHDRLAGTCVIYTWDARPDETFLTGAMDYVLSRRNALKSYLDRHRDN